MARLTTDMPDVSRTVTALEGAWERISHALDVSSTRLSLLMLVLLACAVLAPLPVLHDVFQRVPVETVPSPQMSERLISPAPRAYETAAAREGPVHTEITSPPGLNEARGVTTVSPLPESRARFQRARLIAQKFAQRVKAREPDSSTVAAGITGEMEPVRVKPAYPQSGTLTASDIAAVPGAVEALGSDAKVAATVETAWTADDIAAARAECKTLLAAGNIEANDAKPIKEGACGSPAPVSVRRVGTPAVQLEPAATMNCRVAAGLSEWLSDKVQPAAKKHFGKSVIRLISVSSYACRNRNGQADAPLSEHALANAIDVAGFVLADGTMVKVVDGWGATEREKSKSIKTVTLDAGGTVRPAKMSKLGASALSPSAEGTGGGQPSESSASARFLHAVHSEACGIFGTVLGPEANEAHRDHLHLDMKERRHNAFCQ